METATVRKAKKSKPVSLDSLKLTVPLPSSEEAERGVIGCLLLDPARAMGELASADVREEDFSDIRLQVIFGAAEQATQVDRKADFFAVRERLKDANLLESVGGDAWLGELQDGVPAASFVGNFLPSLAEKSERRRAVQFCREAAETVCGLNGDAGGWIEEFERRALAVRRRKSSGRKSLVEQVRGALDKIEQKFSSAGAISGLSTGFPDLDRYTDGLCAAELIVPAAFSGEGKTSLSMNFVEHAVMTMGEPCAVFSLEMTAEQLVTRMMCSHARVNLKSVGRGQMVDDDFRGLSVTAAKLAAAKLYLVDDADSVGQIVAESRRLVAEHGVKLIVVDYLQLVTGGATGRGDNRENEVGGAAAALKRLAREMKVAVVAPSQLNDDGQLRESRAIGQHADGVWHLEPVRDAGDDSESGPVRLAIRKNRNGPRGVYVDLTFMRKWTRFESAAMVSEEQTTI